MQADSALSSRICGLVRRNGRSRLRFTIVTVVKKMIRSIAAEFAVYAPLPLPSDATEIAVWMTQPVDWPASWKKVPWHDRRPCRSGGRA
jgi:hypothetical protein